MATNTTLLPVRRIIPNLGNIQWKYNWFEFWGRFLNDAAVLQNVRIHNYIWDSAALNSPLGIQIYEENRALAF